MDTMTTTQRSEVVEGGATTMRAVLATGYRCTAYEQISTYTGVAFTGTISDPEGRPVLRVENNGTGGCDIPRWEVPAAKDALVAAAEQVCPDPGYSETPLLYFASVLMTHWEISTELNRKRNLLVTFPKENGDFWDIGVYEFYPNSGTIKARRARIFGLYQQHPDCHIWDREARDFIPIQTAYRKAAASPPSRN